MIPKQDRQGVRKAMDIEQKYDLNKDYSAIEKMAASANQSALNATSVANNAATLASQVNTNLNEFEQTTAENFNAVDTEIDNLSESVSNNAKSIEEMDERIAELDGEDGFSPTVEVSKTGGTTTLTITDKNGAKTATINDGKDGYTPQKGVDYFDGEDGYTPQKGVDYFDGKDGEDGYTPVKGVDYFDGEDGQPGKDGTDGKNATINGVNALTIEAGENIELEQTDDVLVINATGGGGVEVMTADEIKAICGYSPVALTLAVNTSATGTTWAFSVDKTTVWKPRDSVVITAYHSGWSSGSRTFSFTVTGATGTTDSGSTQKSDALTPTNLSAQFTINLSNISGAVTITIAGVA